MTYTILMEKQKTIDLVHLLSHKLMWQCIKYLGLGYHNQFNTATFCIQINTLGAASGAGTAYPSGAASFTPGFQWGTRSLVLCVCFVDRGLSFCTSSFGHCVVCSSSIYGFWFCTGTPVLSILFVFYSFSPIGFLFMKLLSY